MLCDLSDFQINYAENDSKAKWKLIHMKIVWLYLCPWVFASCVVPFSQYGRSIRIHLADPSLMEWV